MAEGALATMLASRRPDEATQNSLQGTSSILVPEALYPSAEWRRHLMLDAAWLEDCCLGLGRPISNPGILPWPIVAFPSFIDPALSFPLDCLHTYHELEWRGDVSRQPFDALIRPKWVSQVRHGTETALETVMGNALGFARSLFVYQVPQLAPTWGQRAVVVPPGTGRARSAYQLVLNEHDVEALARLTGVYSPLNQDPNYAWSRGHPNVIAPGLLVALTMLQHARPPRAGYARIWFRAPIMVGGVLSVFVDDSEPDSVWILKKPNDVVAAVAVIGGGPARQAHRGCVQR